MLLLLYVEGCTFSKVEKECYHINAFQNCKYNDCNFWIDINCEKTIMHIGTAGACSKITEREYALILDSILTVQKINKLDMPQLKLIYLNIYGEMNIEYINKVNSSTVWESSKCNGLSNEECFSLFNSEIKYTKDIEDVILKHFPKSYKISFEEITCLPKDSIQKKLANSKLMKSGYPVEFKTIKFQLQQ
jgi:hypothetical protein